MTITIDLDGPGFSALAEEASGLGVSVEQLADTIIRRHLRARTAKGTIADDEVFRKAMADTFRENEEVYRRLAR
jgi:hypothetical protein